MLPLMLCPLLLAPLTLASPLPSHPHHPAPAPHTYEHTYYDDSAVLAAKDKPGYDEIYFNSRLTEAALGAGFVFFVYHAFVRPEQIYNPALVVLGRDGAGQAVQDKAMDSSGGWAQSWVADAALQALQSIDVVGRGLDQLGLEGAECHKRAVCEAGGLLGESYGWAVPAYRSALQSGSEGADCAKLYTDCSTAPLSAVYRTLFRK